MEITCSFFKGPYLRILTALPLLFNSLSAQNPAGGKLSGPAKQSIETADGKTIPNPYLNVNETPDGFVPEFDHIIGPVFELKGRTTAMDALIGTAPDAFYHFRHEGGFRSNYTIRRFNPKGELVYAKEAVLGDYLGGNGYLRSVFYKQGKVLVFVHHIKGKVHKLGVLQYDASTGEKIGDVTWLDETTEKVNNIISMKSMEYKFSFSPDDKKLLAISELQKKNKRQQVVAQVFELPSLTRISVDSLTTDYKGASVFSTEYAVDNKGDMAFVFGYPRSADKGVVLNYNDEDILNSDVYRDLTYAVGVLRLNEHVIKIYDIPDKDRTILSPKLAAASDRIVCSAHYNNGEKNYKATAKTIPGFFSMMIDPRAEKVSREFTQIDPAKAVKLASKVKSEQELFNSANSEFNYVNHGSFFDDSGYYNLWERCNRLGETDQVNLEMLVIRYNNVGQASWQTFVPRFSMAGGADIMAFTGDKFYLIYRENYNNVEYPVSWENYVSGTYLLTTGRNSSSFVCTAIDNKGTARRRLILKDLSNIYVGSDNPKCALMNRSIITSQYDDLKRSHGFFVMK